MSKFPNPEKTRFGLLVTAAGMSSRMGGGEKKEYRKVDGKPVILRCILSFLEAADFTQIVVTVPPRRQEPGHLQRMEELLAPLNGHFPSAMGKILFTEGGETRQESVHRGLSAFTESVDYVLIHDAARPWISGDLTARIMADCSRNRAVIPVIPLTDAVKKIDGEGFISEHLERSLTVGAQTPQAFPYRAILDAHRRARGDGRSYVDDSEIYSRYLAPVHTVPGEPANVKITFPRDFEGKNRERVQ